MRMNDYQNEAAKTAVYPEGSKIIYPILGLASEAGEVAGKAAKWYRGDRTFEEYRQAIKPELGDVLWMLAMSAKDLGFTLDDIAQDNLDKLRDRQARGVLKGDGDKR